MALPETSLFDSLSDKDFTEKFIEKPLSTAVELLKHENQKNRLWRLLDKPNNQNLINAYKHVQNILGPIPTSKAPTIPIFTPAAQPQPQATPTPAPTTPPTITASQAIPSTSKPTPGNSINAENAPKIEAWMNGIKDHVYNSFAKPSPEVNNQTTRRDLGASQQFTKSLQSSLSMYRGGLAGFYLNEGSKELIFSALGPLGDVFRSLYEKDIKRKMDWMKNPLNPQAINYYLSSLPNQMAFKLLYLPAKATFGILARGGAPLISKVTYGEFGKPKTSYVFTPLLKTAQFTNKLADLSDKISGVSTDDFRQDPRINSPYEQYIENTNNQFSESLSSLKRAKLSNNKNDIKEARRQLRLVLDEHDGFYRFQKDKNGKLLKDQNGKPLKISKLSLKQRSVFDAAGVSRAIFKNGLKNFSRRARRASRDPIVGLFALIAGVLWDITAGLALNVARIIVTRVIDLFGGATLRAQITEFITSSRFATTARIGGATSRSFIKGTFSLTTGASIYGGTSIGGWIANALGLPTLTGQIIGGGIGATFGSIYTTALKMANSPTYFNINGTGWIQKIQKLESIISSSNSSLSAKTTAETALSDISLKGFKLGPLSKLASFFNKVWLARLPINGWMFRDILLKTLPADLLSTKFLGMPVVTIIKWLPAIDYLWQIKGGLWKLWTQETWKIFGKTITTPYQLSVNFTKNLSNRLVRYYSQNIIRVWEPGTVSFIERRWFTFVNKYIFTPFSKFFNFSKPFLKNFFNPGFFVGMQFLGPTLMSIGLPWGVAHFVGGLAGSLTWNLAAFGLEKIFGTTIASMSRINAAGWAGYMVGSILQVIFPSLPAYFNIFASVAFIATDMILIATHTSLLILAQSALSSLVGIITGSAAAGAAAAASLAVWASLASVLAIAGIAVVFTFSLFAGFWVPINEEYFAKPVSSNFTINNTCTLIAPNQYNCCSNFSVTQNVFNAVNYLDLVTNLNGFPHLTINLTNPESVLSVQRNYVDLDYNQTISYPYNSYPDLALLELNQYTLRYNSSNPIINSGGTTAFTTYLSTPDKNRQNLFTLMQQNQIVVSEMEPFFNILTRLAKEHSGNQVLVQEYTDQQALMEQQKKLVDDLIPKIKAENLTQAIEIANNYLDKNPLEDPCPKSGPPCTPEQQTQKDLYDSWEEIVNDYIYTINNYQDQAKPDLQTYADSLTQESENLALQIDLLKQIITQIKKIQSEMTDDDANTILNTIFLNFTHMTLSQQNDAWILLNKYFDKIFNNKNEFYFIPKNTSYQMCVVVDYCFPIDPNNPPSCPAGEPQTFCSTISYSPSEWSPNTGYAKSCTTFTP